MDGSIVLLYEVFRNDLRIPDFPSFTAQISSIFDRCHANRGGKVTVLSRHERERDFLSKRDRNKKKDNLDTTENLIENVIEKVDKDIFGKVLGKDLGNVTENVIEVIEKVEILTKNGVKKAEEVEEELFALTLVLGEPLKHEDDELFEDV